MVHSKCAMDEKSTPDSGVSAGYPTRTGERESVTILAPPEKEASTASKNKHPISVDSSTHEERRENSYLAVPVPRGREKKLERHLPPQPRLHK